MKQELKWHTALRLLGITLLVGSIMQSVAVYIVSTMEIEASEYRIAFYQGTIHESAYFRRLLDVKLDELKNQHHDMIQTGPDSVLEFHDLGHNVYPADLDAIDHVVGTNNRFHSISPPY